MAEPNQGQEDWGQIVMPVGKYKGYTIEQIPDFYIKWLAENWRGEEICNAADSELKYRKQWNISITEDPTGQKQTPAPRPRTESSGGNGRPPESSGFPEDEDIPF